jgi:hypothetical protein
MVSDWGVEIIFWNIRRGARAMTWLAMSPSAFAVFKLTISLVLVGRMTGSIGNIRAHGTGNAPARFCSSSESRRRSRRTKSRRQNPRA